MDTNVASTPAALKNDNRLSKLKNEVKELGRNKAKGEDALPMLGFKICGAVFDGVFTLNKKDPKSLVKSNRAGDDGKFPMVDYVQYLYELYVIEETDKAIHERSSKSFEIQVSKVRQFANLGALDPVVGPEVLNRALIVYTNAVKVRSDEDKGKKANSAFDFYLNVCRAQCHKDNRDTMLTDDQMKAFIWKESAPKETTIEGTIQRAIDILELLYTDGIECKVTGDKIIDRDDRVKAAIDLLNERVKSIATAKEVVELQARLAALTAKK